MKQTPLLLALSLLPFSIAAAPDVAEAQKPPAADERAFVQPWQVTRRDAHENVWEAVSSVTDAVTGLQTVTRHRYHELGTGLNAPNARGEFVPAQPSFTLTADGAEALGTIHQVRIISDITRLDAIQLTTPEGLLQRSHPLAIVWFDPTDGSTVVLGVVTNALGWLTAPNEIVFSNCFAGLSASILLRNSLRGFSQTLLLHESPGSPEALGLSPATRLELMTEFTPDTPLPDKSVTLLSAETDPVLRARMAEPDFTDETLSFGNMTLMPGRGFSLTGPADPQARNLQDGVPVGKQFMVLMDRPILIESVEHRKIRSQLEKLPAANLHSATRPQRPATLDTTLYASRTSGRRLPAQPKATAAKARIQTAASAHPTKAGGPVLAALSVPPCFAIDYEELNVQTNAVQLLGNTTYYVTAPVILAQTLTIDGGSVIKFSPTNTSGFTVYATNLICRTSPYRPATLTCRDNDAVGDPLEDSDGTPETDLQNVLCLYLLGPFQNTSLQYLRLSYCSQGIYFEGDGAVEARHLQFAHCTFPIAYTVWSGTQRLALRNLLIWDSGAALSGYYCGWPTNSYTDLQHVTIDTAGYLFYGDYGSTLTLTNCLLTAVTNYYWVPDVFLTNCTPRLSNSAGVFSTLGAGSHYLSTNSPYRGAANPNLPASLKSDLAGMTTWPPTLFERTMFTNDLTLTPLVPRDPAGQDVGYHYDAMDVVFGDAVLRAQMRALPGTVMGWFEPSLGLTNYGLVVADGAALSLEGTAEAPCRFVRYNTVQEGGTSTWTNSGVRGGVLGKRLGAAAAPQLTARFSKWSCASGDPNHFRDDWVYWEVRASHSEFAGGNITSTIGPYSFTNCLFDGVVFALDGTMGGIGLEIWNSLYHGGDFWLRRYAGQTPYWRIKDTVFDAVGVSITDALNGNTNYTAFDYNGFVNGSDRLTPQGSNDLVLTNLVWQTGPLGAFYCPSNSALTNSGSRFATNALLGHFTVLTNQTPEGSTIVDRGYHYPALNGSGELLDSDGDGIPDVIEDANLNSTVDSGETDWQSASDQGLRIWINRPRSGSSVP